MGNLNRDFPYLFYIFLFTKSVFCDRIIEKKTEKGVSDVLQTDHQYFKDVMSAIGRTMLIFLLAFNIYGAGITFLAFLLSFLPIGDVAFNVIYQTFYAAGYMLAFILPVWFLYRFLKKSGCTVQPMALSPRLSPMLVPIVFAGITVCFAMAQINTAIVDLFGYSDFMSDLMEETTAATAPYEIVLNFMVISVVPAFCEEFLFRGAILSNLRPFGRSNAVIISAVLFALMHQNAGQLLYTFAAGIVLGLVYEYTGSIWNCTILHLMNNFVSVVQSAVLAKYGETVYAATILTVIEVGIYLIGAVSIGILVYKHFSKRETLEDGAFEKNAPIADAYAAHPVRGREALKLFFCPSMIVFVAFVAVQIGALILLSFVM